MHTSPAHAKRAVAHPNIALVKYWGKQNGPNNVPAVGSLSVTLDTLQTTTTVWRDDSLLAHVVETPGPQYSDRGSKRVLAFLNLIKTRAQSPFFVHVQSSNNFATAAGLASSASGFAALAVAACAAYGLRIDAKALSILARQGSGSAARSIFGGFALMHRGHLLTGEDAYAEPFLAPGAWPLKVVVAVTHKQPKITSSTDGMQHCQMTSPYYAAWCHGQDADIAEAIAAINSRDFAALGRIAEHSCMKMHACAMAAKPPLVYLNAATWAGINCVRALQKKGVPVFFTIDAGPQVKAVCQPEAADEVAHVLSNTAGVLDVTVVGLGDGARLVPLGPQRQTATKPR